MRQLAPAIAALLLAVPSAALAQEAAPPAPVDQPAAPAPEQIDAHRKVLEKTIADMKAARTDYASMAPDLAAKVKASEASITPALQGLGKLQSVEFAGLQNGAFKFRVAFEQAQTTWLIAVGPDGKISFLVLRVG